jgi:penicillin-binding protein 2
MWLIMVRDEWPGYPVFRLPVKQEPQKTMELSMVKEEKLEDHSWFVCFAPRENPRIAVAVIVENAGFGATWAGPIASMVMEKYLNDTLSTERLKDFDRIAAKEIILPVVKQKRMRLDSIRG